MGLLLICNVAPVSQIPPPTLVAPSSNPAAVVICAFAASRFKDQMPIFLNPDLMFFALRAAFRDLEVHSYRSRFPTLLFLFPRVHASLIFLNAVLKGSKHDTSRGCSAWLV